VHADVQRERVAACHWLLLRLAGTVPDDLVTQCRGWLAESRTCDVGRAITYSVLSQRIRLTDAEIDLLAELLGAAAVDTSGLSMVDVLDSEPMPKYAFAPYRGDADRGTRVGAADERPGAPVIAVEPDDDVDRAVLAGIGPEPAIRAVWRAWRFPTDGALWPPPRRVYVAEADQGVDLAGVAARLQCVASGTGETDPQVEVYPVHAALPNYQRLARAYGALIWARDPDPGLRLAVVFNQDGEHGSSMAAAHPAAGAPDAAQLARYLSRGEPLLVTTARMKDVVTPARGAVVPMNFRTDGHWIWSDATIYYLEQYGLAPDADLVAHIHRRAFVFPGVDGAAIHRALAALQEPAADEPAWTYGS
jgi:hypothetical protein